MLAVMRLSRPSLAQVGPVNAQLVAPGTLSPLLRNPARSDVADSLQPVEVANGIRAVPRWFQGNEVCKLVYAAHEGFGKRRDSDMEVEPGGKKSRSVLLSIYDVGQVLPESWHNKWKAVCTQPVHGVWHSSLKAFGDTYDNPRHVNGRLPRVLSPDMRYQYELQNVRTPEEFATFFADISSQERWHISNYDVRYNNCNHFIVECLRFLVGPDKASRVIAEREYLSPMDFAKQPPPASLGHEFNELVMKGMVERQRIQRNKEKETQAEREKKDRASALMVALAAVVSIAYVSSH